MSAMPIQIASTLGWKFILRVAFCTRSLFFGMAMTVKKNVMGMIPLFLVFVFSVGCATYQKNQGSARDKIRSGSYDEAVQMLEERANKEGDDQLVYLLDYATALQLAGRYKESNKAFQKAEEIADIQDYTSLSRETGAILLSEELVQYKGEDFEKVMINAVAAINYLELGDLDSALVEVRRLNNKLYKYKYEGKRPYEQSAFAFYLSAAIWEADQKWDDAYIAYKKAYEVAPGFAPLKQDLIRAARRAQRMEDFEKWKAQFTDIELDPKWGDRNFGELIVVYQQGWGPRKAPRPESHRFPRLVPVRSSTVAAEVQVLAPDTEIVKASAVTETVYSVQEVAIKTLEDQYAALVARRVAGVVAKEVIAEQIRQKNELLGAVAWVALHATDRADLRQWSTLPETFQIARIMLPAGKYKIQLSGRNSNRESSGEASGTRDVEIKPRKKAFVTWRSTN
jgi:hypothetical protein